MASDLVLFKIASYNNLLYFKEYFSAQGNENKSGGKCVEKLIPSYTIDGN